jgi:hypothetical protein
MLAARSGRFSMRYSFAAMTILGRIYSPPGNKSNGAAVV